MPVPIPGLKVGSDSQKVKFLTIFGRPKTGIFREFRGVPGRAPLATRRLTGHQVHRNQIDNRGPPSGGTSGDQVRLAAPG